MLEGFSFSDMYKEIIINCMNLLNFLHFIYLCVKFITSIQNSKFKQETCISRMQKKKKKLYPIYLVSNALNYKFIFHSPRIYMLFVNLEA